MKQYAVELHSHTEHSDGDFTVEELVDEAVEYGYDALILTDHNTSSGYKELEKRAKNKGLVTLSGIEWTTYFGHMLVHDADKLVDWRTATPHTIDAYIQEVKEANGLVGIAHPFAIGSPICTGCHWSFLVKNWANVDYIEVWNSTCPDEHFWSREAYHMWINLLDEGYTISCSAGRDWHRNEGEKRNPALTYIETDEELTSTSFRQALEKGAFYITLGPKINWHIEKDTRVFRMGDVIQPGKSTLHIERLEDLNKELKQFSPELKQIKVFHNGELINERPSTDTEAVSFNLNEGYIRIEGWGNLKGKNTVQLLISNPIYIRK